MSTCASARSSPKYCRQQATVLDRIEGLAEADNTLTDPGYRAIRLPAMVLAEYRDGPPVCVTPHSGGDRVALSTGDPTEFEAVTARTPDVTVGEEPAAEAPEETPAPLQKR